MKASSILLVRRLLRLAVQLLPGTRALVRPVFIVGCGRSGTTALGEVMGRHPLLAYLNEPREIWLYEPRTDIWSARALARGGRLRLSGSDVQPAAAARIRRAFAAEVRLQRAERLVEKLPINAFRIDYIAAMFPDAQFVHLIRNGLEVAASIAKQDERGRWFGHQDCKWRWLVEHARERGEAGRVAHCAASFERGLLEWYLSVSAALESLGRLPATRWLELRYEAMVAAPGEVCERLEGFIGVRHEPALREAAITGLRRRPAPSDPAPLLPRARPVAGDLLARLGYAGALDLTPAIGGRR
ncbi:MAG TPA: sulfotransferase [Geminicoccaceae bacterium]|nr:sulfotransferase [Geminicoccaceae bacterium]